MDYPRLLGITLEIAIIVIFASLFTFCPKLILRSTARLERWWYKQVLQVSDEKLDKSPFPTAWGLVKIPRSQYIKRAEEHPEEFGVLLSIFRIIGVSLWSMLILTFMLLIWGIATGRMVG